MFRLDELEARDVPAVVLDGAATLSVTEAPGIVDDTVALTQSGDTITVFSAAGILVRDESGALVDVGTAVSLDGVKRIDVSLSEGGDDVVSDDTDIAVSIDAGPGNDRVTSSGGRFNPLLLPLLTGGAFDPALLPLVAEEIAKKSLAGGDGDDLVAGPLLGFFARLDGGAGDDTIFGGFGPDVVTGGAGRDALFGVGGNDFYDAKDGEVDLVFGTAAALLFDPFDAVIR